MLKKTLAFAAAAAIAACAAAAEAPRRLPTPPSLSVEMAAAVSEPPSALWAYEPKSLEDWHALAADYARAASPEAERMLEKYGVSCIDDVIAGVPVHRLSPKNPVARHEGKVVLYIHGGGYVLGQGITGILEAVPLVGLEGWETVSVDYRLAPDHPFPAATDDVFAVYRALVKARGAENVAVYGTSTGGALALITGIRASEENVPMPAVIVAGTPWSDMGKVGDTYFTNAGVDNVLGSYEGLLSASVKAYAGNENLRNPLLSPVYASDADLERFPPTLFVSGTRDLFLSNTVRMHRRLLVNNVHADLLVHEGLSHAQYYFVEDAPETIEHYRFVSRFLNRHLSAAKAGDGERPKAAEASPAP